MLIAVHLSSKLKRKCSGICQQTKGSKWNTTSLRNKIHSRRWLLVKRHKVWSNITVIDNKLAISEMNRFMWKYVVQYCLRLFKWMIYLLYSALGGSHITTANPYATHLYNPFIIDITSAKYKSSACFFIFVLVSPYIIDLSLSHSSFGEWLMVVLMAVPQQNMQLCIFITALWLGSLWTYLIDSFNYWMFVSSCLWMWRELKSEHRVE